MQTLSFEIQEALLSTLYPIVPRVHSFQQYDAPYHKYNSSQCCNCGILGSFESTVYWIIPHPREKWHAARMKVSNWLRHGFGSLDEPNHYYCNPTCSNCTITINQFMEDNIIASFSVTFDQFDSICTFFTHELNRVVFQYTNPYSCASYRNVTVLG